MKYGDTQSIVHIQGEPFARASDHAPLSYPFLPFVYNMYLKPDCLCANVGPPLTSAPLSSFLFCLAR